MIAILGTNTCAEGGCGIFRRPALMFACALSCIAAVNFLILLFTFLLVTLFSGDLTGVDILLTNNLL